MERVGQVLTREGLASTLKRGVRYLFNCRYYLLREPVAPLGDAPLDTPAGRVAVQIHLYYPELAQEMLDYTNRIPFPFDCFVSTDTDEKAARIRQVFAGASKAAKVEVAVFPNRGRDVAPFLWQMAPLADSYDYCCHLHTKHSLHGDFGDRWRRYLLESLLASPAYIAAILRRFQEDPQLGLVFQQTYPPLKPYLGWRGNQAGAARLFARMNLPFDGQRRPDFPAGNMFWIRMAALRPVLRCDLTEADFPRESGQVEHTTAHCLERSWSLIGQAQGYHAMRVTPRNGRRGNKRP